MKKKMFFGFYDLNGVPRKVLKLVIKSDKQGALEELMIFPSDAAWCHYSLHSTFLMVL